MLLYLNIFSSLAVIIYSLIAYLQYRQGDKQYKNKLRLEVLAKLKTDFLAWLKDYMYLTHTFIGESVRNDLNALDLAGLLGDEKERLFMAQEQAQASKGKYRRDLDFQVFSLDLVKDERRENAPAMQAAITEHHQQILALVHQFSETVYQDLLPQMKAAPDDTEKRRDIMAQARQAATQLRQGEAQLNHQLNQLLKANVHMIDDEIEKYFK